jgi:hypothetical protein
MADPNAGFEAGGDFNFGGPDESLRQTAPSGGLAAGGDFDFGGPAAFSTNKV